jgi:plasmid stabilization system protein ParE
VTRPLRTEDEAVSELDAAIRWYDERRPGLGADFLAAVDATLDHIVRLPHAGAPVPRVPMDLPVRRTPVKRFPYHVVYLETSESIRILAFAHDSRRPGYWHRRTVGH